jgi:membrane associated rhomboid family serine protease
VNIETGFYDEKSHSSYKVFSNSELPSCELEVILNQSVPHISLLSGIRIPLIILGVMWAVFGFEHYYEISCSAYGIYPRDFVGLRGVLLAPFIHGDLQHIINNSYPILILGTALYFFYPKAANAVVVYSFLMTGLWVWAMARPSFHIGASGVIYAWGAFLFSSGAINRNIRMMGLSLLVVFLYGSLVWGVLPIVPEVSWESHLLGALSGIILAFVFRKSGPQRKKYHWEEEDDQYEIEFWKMTPEEIEQYYREKNHKKTSADKAEVRITYVFKPKSNDSA